METKLSVGYQDFEQLLRSSLLKKGRWTNMEIERIIKTVMETFSEVEIIKN